MTVGRRPNPAASCRDCLAWGVLTASRCQACDGFRHRHEAAACSGCGHQAPLKRGYCRLCWRQAGADAKDAGRPSGPATALAPVPRPAAAPATVLADLQRRWSRKNPARTPPRPAAGDRSRPAPTAGTACGHRLDSGHPVRGPPRSHRAGAGPAGRPVAGLGSAPGSPDGGGLRLDTGDPRPYSLGPGHLPGRVRRRRGHPALPALSGAAGQKPGHHADHRRARQAGHLSR